jgi:hypothetical protein
MKPSEYFRRNVFLGASCMPRREVEMRQQIGVGNIMWGSDYPHPEGTWPSTRQHLVDAFRGVPTEELAEMLGGNAARIYGFDTHKLAPLVARIGPEKRSFEPDEPPRHQDRQVESILGSPTELVGKPSGSLGESGLAIAGLPHLGKVHKLPTHPAGVDHWSNELWWRPYAAWPRGKLL